MKNESSIGQPIPTAVLTPTEIIAPPDTISDSQMDPVMVEPDPPAASQSMNVLAEMMFAPIAFWTSLSTAYFRMFGLIGPASPSWQRND